METGKEFPSRQHYKLNAPDVADVFKEQCGSSETLWREQRDGKRGILGNDRQPNAVRAWRAREGRAGKDLCALLRLCPQDLGSH